jgi:hypothetical protein
MHEFFKVHVAAFAGYIRGTLTLEKGKVRNNNQENITVSYRLLVIKFRE